MDPVLANKKFYRLNPNLTEFAKPPPIPAVINIIKPQHEITNDNKNLNF